MIKRRTAPEIIGTHLCWDVSEVSEGRYQSTRYTNPSVYICGDDYYAAPSNNKPPKNPSGNWEKVGEYYGRSVYCMTLDKRTS